MKGHERLDETYLVGIISVQTASPDRNAKIRPAVDISVVVSHAFA